MGNKQEYAFMLIITALSFISSSLFAQGDIRNTLELAANVPTTYNGQPLPIKTNYNPNGPMNPDFFITSKGEICLVDLAYNSIVMLGGDYSVKKIIKTKLLYGDDAYRYYPNSEGFLCDYSQGTILAQYSHDGELLYLIRNQSELMDYIATSQFLAFLDKDGKLFSIVEPSKYPSNNEAKKLDEKATLAILADDKRAQFSEVKIDDNKRFFVGGVFLSHSFAAFTDYFNGQHKVQKPPKNLYYHDWTSNRNNLDSFYLVGRDAGGGYYWTNGTYVAVFDGNGWLINYIRCPFDEDLMMRGAAIHPSGDVYLVSFGESVIKIYRYKNKWDPEKRALWYEANRFLK